MKALMIPLLFTLVGGSAGIGVGIFLDAGRKSEGEEVSNEGDNSKQESSEYSESEGDIEFARLNNQFIVPVVNGSSVEALVVLSITIEVSPGGTEYVFQNEPRVRDRFLRVLFDHANAGGFSSTFTQTSTMALLRRGLNEAAEKVLGDIVQDVLIIDIVRQEI